MSTYLPGEHLPLSLLALLKHIVDGLPNAATADALLRQAALAQITNGSPTMIDVATRPDLAPVPLPNGPIPVRAIVYGKGDDSVGEILVWVRDGQLIGLEQAWWTDDPPSRWPESSEVRLL